MHFPQVLMDERQVQERVRALGQSIRDHYAFIGDEPLVVVPILKGSFMFAADLVRAIQRPLRIDFMGLQSYGASTETSGVVRIVNDLSRSIQHQHVLVVEDIVDTGLSMTYLFENLNTRHPASIKLASLLHKPSRTQAPVHIDFLGFTIEDRFVVGYGLDYDERYRELPYIGVLD